MDPLPFLALAVMIFGSLQAGAYIAWRSTMPKPQITGIGEVKGSQYVADKIPKRKK